MRHDLIVYKHCRDVMCPSVDVQVAHIGKHFFDQSPFLTNSCVVTLNHVACPFMRFPVHGLHRPKTNSNFLWRSTLLESNNR